MRSILTSLFIFCSVVAFSQSEITILAGNLLQPVGIAEGPNNTILIAEAGTGQDDGGVSILHPQLGPIKVLDNMPSYFDTATQEVLGPMRVQMVEGSLAAVFMAQVPGPLGSSILIFDANDLQDVVLAGGTLGPDDALHQIKLRDFVLDAGFEDSNPFSMVHDGCNMYIVDAAANAIIKRDGLTGVLSVFAVFDNVPNPAAPLGPPTVHAVPTKIVQDTSGFLVASLTGFPFNTGAANIYHVDMDGQVTVRDSGYSLVTDLMMHPEGDGFYALQFANFSLDSMPPFIFNSSIITHTNAAGERDTIHWGFGPSPGFLYGGEDVFYVSNLFTGTLARLEPTSTGLLTPDHSFQKSLKVFPNPTSRDINLNFELAAAGQTHIEVYNALGQNVYRKELGNQLAGSHTIKLDIPGLNSAAGQMYYVIMKSGNNWYQATFTVVD
ncbi:MAG TPA: ScyD/ScyE family protein [Membranihabitans sp.]|nr:ScyD/ScyE family protein [Membranihabitans sp.]